MALKKLVTSAAAIAMLGCSDGATEETATAPPAFAGEVPIGSGPVDTAPAGANDPSPSGGGVGEAPAAGELPNEGQSPDNVGIAGSEEPEPAGSGGEAPSEMSEEAAAAEEPAAEEPVAEEPVAEEPVAEEPEPVAEEPAPEPVAEEPEPIVRPPLNCGAPAQPLQGAGVQGCNVNDNGSVLGQSWFLWYNGGGGGCMTTYENPGGAFSAQWNNPGDFLARIGFWFDETQTFDQLGEIGADLRFTKQGSGGGFSFIGIYGWTTDPLIEYYIVEDSFGNGPAQPFATQMRGSFNVDGAQYNVYSGNRQNQPSIVGDANFQQFFSVRQNPRQCGHVSISQHFRQWRSMGMNLGNMYESKILVEAGGGNGGITFSHANVSITPPN